MRPDREGRKGGQKVREREVRSIWEEERERMMEKEEVGFIFNLDRR